MKHKFTYLLLIAILFTGVLPASAAPALGNNDPTQTTLCDQVALDQAEADFRSLLSENGQVPVDDPAVESAAQLVINLSKKCYDTMQAKRNSLNLQGGDPIFIDEGPIDRYTGGRAEAFIASDAKWGAPTLGTPGGTVTYSFMGSGLNLSTEGNPSFGKSVAFTSLKGFSPCFLTEVQTAFAAWSAVSDINFVEVADSNTAFDAVGATGDIRIGAHAFDGVYGTLAHAYLPYNYYTGDGDIHFDKDESWSCTTSGGFDIGLVALHEIGHAIGLYHENTSTIAIMDPSYNPSLSSLQSDDIAGARAIYGVAPESIFAPAGNDEIGTATLITGLTYQDQVNTSGTTPDNHPYSSSDPNPITCTDHLGTPNSLGGGWSTVWYKYKTPATVNESIQADTNGTTSYDTYIAVYKGDASGNLPSYTGFVGCNDDSPEGPFSRISFVGTKDTWYYFEVAQFRCFAVDTGGCATVPNPIGGDLTFNVNITNTDINVAGTLHQSVYTYAGKDDRYIFAGLNSGPMVVSSRTALDHVDSIKVLFKNVSYSEMLGFPTSQIGKEYWFPVYNSDLDSSGLNAQLRFGNLENSNTTINVYVGDGTLLESFILGANEATRRNYKGIDDGPLHIVSSATNIMTSVRYLYNGLSYSEELGFPDNLLTTEYWFPWYNNYAFSSELRVANTGAAEANVTVYVGNNVVVDSFLIGVGQNVRKSYDGLNDGPLRVVTSSSTILPSIKVLFKGISYSEMLGVPTSRLTKEYWMPVYESNELLPNSQIRVGNVGGIPTTISIYVGDGTLLESFTLGAGEATRRNYKGTDDGPLHIVSSTTDILASLRQYYVTTGFESYYELMMYPNDQLTTEYVFPWYNNYAFSSELRVAAPTSP